jgi:NAD-dependent SIR2 family protein deacetylase
MVLQAPASLSQLEFEKLISQMHGQMGFNALDKERDMGIGLRFIYAKEKVGLLLMLEGEWPVQLDPIMQEKFMIDECHGKKRWRYGVDIDIFAEESKGKGSLTDQICFIYEPLDYSSQRVICLSESITSIARKLRGKQSVIYTGAGISASAVPTLSALMQSLDLVSFRGSQKVADLVIKVLNEPQQFLEPMMKFFQACYQGMPTKAHLAIRDICLLKNWGLLTENLDLLHQKTGIAPLAPENENWLANNIKPEDLKKLDYILVIGQSRDNSGFLGWYRYHNPDGIIIGFDKQQPSYLGQQDILVEGDVQETIPELFALLKANDF